MNALPAQVQKEVAEELHWEPSLDPSKVGISVEKGVVMLSGHVRSLSEKMAAERAAKRVRGVGAVANELEVELSPTHVRDDVDIASAAQNALQWNYYVPAGRIKVTVSRGWLTLEGEVDAAYELRAAQQAVANLTGVTCITNRITVRPMASSHDVRRQLNTALHRYATIEANSIDVETTGGKVTLKGRVRGWAEKELVEDAAWAAPGVTQVDNRIVVGP